MMYENEHNVHINKEKREDQGKTLWRVYLRDKCKALKYHSRRKQLVDGGSEVDDNERADRRTDPDEFGYYGNYWTDRE